MNFKNLHDEIAEFIVKQSKKIGTKNLVVGMSGGLDSAVVGAICAGICAKDDTLNTHAIMLPTKTSNSKNLKDAISHCESFHIPYEIISIQGFVDEFLRINPNSSKLRIGNFVARIRMNMLYDYSAKIDGVVIGTSNLSERMLGYGTIWGDLACAFNPIGEILKSDIFEFAKFLKINNDIIAKAPSADLWEGQSDEGDLGYSYFEIDKVLREIKNGRSFESLNGEFNSKIIEFIKDRMEKNSFKLAMPPVAKITNY